MPTAIVVIAEPAEIHRSFLLLFCHTQKRDVILTTECLIAFKNTRPNFRHTEPPQSPLKSALAADASQHSEESLRLGNTSDVRIATRKSTVVFAFYTWTPIGLSLLKGTYVECVHKICQGTITEISLSSDEQVSWNESRASLMGIALWEGMQRSDLDVTPVGQSGTVKHLSFEETTCGKNNLGLNAELHFQAGSTCQRFKGFCWVVTIFFFPWSS